MVSPDRRYLYPTSSVTPEEPKSEPIVKKPEVEPEVKVTEADLYKKTKYEQINMLLDLGLTKKEIKKLKYEKNRVDKILELYE